MTADKNDTATPPSQTDDELSPKEIEAGRILFAQDCQFVFGATTADVLPPPDYPEIAFAGRSNVGKSSLINALTSRNTLARTSNTPGRTRQLNFFVLGERLMLVDMPGHGYAKVSKSEIASWGELMDSYLRGRVKLRRLCLLVDSRHGLKPPDLELMDRLDEAAVSYQIVLTKADKVKQGELKRILSTLKSQLKVRPAAHPEIAVTSALDGGGIAQLRAALTAYADPAQADPD